MYCQVVFRIARDISAPRQAKNEAAQYIADLEAYGNEQEQAQEELEERLIHRVHRIKKTELQEALLDLLFTGPEWQVERFLDSYGDFYEE